MKNNFKSTLRRIENEIYNCGISSINNFFPKQDILSLQKISNNVLKNPVNQSQAIGRNYYSKAYYTANKAVGAPVFGHSKKLDNMMRTIINSHNFQNICKSLGGEQYRINTIGFRRSVANTKRLGLHQDTIGNATLCIPLSDIKKKFRSYEYY